MSKIICIALIIALLMVPGIMAVELNSNVLMTGTGVSVVKSNTDYKGVSNNTITQYEQYVYAVGQENFEYENTGTFADLHNVGTSTNLSGNRAEGSAIGAVNFIENVGNGVYNGSISCCVFATHGSGHDLTVATDVGLQETSIDYLYGIEATFGEVGSGRIKKSDNVTVHSTHYTRADKAVLVGQESCMRYPAAEINNGKPEYCVFQGKGVGYPIFTPRTGPEVVNES